MAGHVDETTNSLKEMKDVDKKHACCKKILHKTMEGKNLMVGN
jgi:hypothetical protein